MIQFIVNGFSRTWSLSFPDYSTSSFDEYTVLEWLLNRLAILEDAQPSQLVLNAHQTLFHSSNPCFLSLSASLPGGKGGYGTLLRGGGNAKQKKGPANTEYSRDLDGRFIRDTNLLIQIKKTIETQQKALLNPTHLALGDKDDDKDIRMRRKGKKTSSMKEEVDQDLNQNYSQIDISSSSISNLEYKERRMSDITKVQQRASEEVMEAVQVGLKKKNEKNEKSLKVEGKDCKQAKFEKNIRSDLIQIYSFDSSSDESEKEENEILEEKKDLKRKAEWPMLDESIENQSTRDKLINYKRTLIEG